MAATFVPRIEDDLALWMIQQRLTGASSAQIGRAIGRTSASVRVTTDRVKRADAAESGEDTTGFYW